MSPNECPDGIASATGLVTGIMMSLILATMQNVAVTSIGEFTQAFQTSIKTTRLGFRV